VVEQLAGDLAELRDPDSGELLYGELVRRDDAYHGPYAMHGPDLVLTLKPGYELKGSTTASRVLGPPAEGLGGMHTMEDAHLFVAGHTLREGPYDLQDLAPTIVELLEMEPQGFQGNSLLGGSQRRSRSAPQPAGVGPL
jgi:predicted AlkP superfamily phosphohydrolase/phosphomutase